MGQLRGSPSTDIVEEGTRPRPYALVYGPSVISANEWAIVVLCLLAVSDSPYIPASSRGGVSASPLCWVASTLLTFGLALLVVSCTIAATFSVLPVLCVDCLGRRRGRDFVVVRSLVVGVLHRHFPLILLSDLISSVKRFPPFDPLPSTRFTSHRDFFSQSHLLASSHPPHPSH